MIDLTNLINSSSWKSPALSQAIREYLLDSLGACKCLSFIFSLTLCDFHSFIIPQVALKAITHEYKSTKQLIKCIEHLYPFQFLALTPKYLGPWEADLHGMNFRIRYFLDSNSSIIFLQWVSGHFFSQSAHGVSCKVTNRADQNSEYPACLCNIRIKMTHPAAYGLLLGNSLTQSSQ